MAKIIGPSSINFNIHSIRQQIERSCANCQPQRDPAEITLLAVSKRQPSTLIAEAYRLGQMDFGENYVQETAAKIHELGDEFKGIWHLIGPLQANKTREAALLFDWFHALDRIKIANRLGAARLAAGKEPINVTVQVNLGEEQSKHGIMPKAVPDFLDQVSAIDGVRLRGLMCIPEPSLAAKDNSKRFAELAALQHAASIDHQLDTLSMGMSDDFSQAISNGATIIRIGTLIFGERL